MKQFKDNITSIYGVDGQQWLDELPSIIAKVARELFLKMPQF